MAGFASPDAVRCEDGPVALVIVPTRELAAQVRGELGWLYAELPALRVEVVTGGTALGPERRNLARKPALVVGTPGRLLDHIRSGALPCASIQHVVLDEADQMFDMGFREELEAILEALPEKRRSHLVSATFPPALRHLADRFQEDPLHLAGTPLGAANQDIEHIAHVVSPRDTYAAIANLLLLAQGQRTLVFVRRRVDTTELAEKLADDGFAALPFSGELPQAQRTRTLSAFRQGRIDALISTDVASRGIDVPGISTVIHADPPENADAYVHRSGRTGRAGETGRSLLLVAGRSQRRMQALLRAARIEAEWRPVPGPKKVRKTLSRNRRRDLAAALEAQCAPGEQPLADAAELLKDRDPREVVAMLLALTEAKLPCEPKEIGSADAPHPTPLRRAAGDRRGGESSEYVRFEINWGGSKGANPSRILSHVCRRGELHSPHVGSIKIGLHSSQFDVVREQAGQFQARASKPDTRDPYLFIRPAGSRPSGPARSQPSAGERRPERPLRKARGQARS